MQEPKPKEVMDGEPSLNPGEKVWFIPDHADGPDHPDAEPGRIRHFVPAANEEAYHVWYYDGSPNAKLTYRRHLIRRDE